MNVIRGTFRLSIVIALLVAAYYGTAAHFAAQNAAAEDINIWITLRCGERFLGQDMSRFTNEAGLIDIGKAGCDLEGKRFLARFDEIRKAVATAEPPNPYGQI